LDSVGVKRRSRWGDELPGLAYGNNNGFQPGHGDVCQRVRDRRVTPPATPAGLTATAGVEQVTLTGSGRHAAGYSIGRATVSAGPTRRRRAAARNFTDTGLAVTRPITTCVGVNPGSQSGNSAQASATRRQRPPPWLAQGPRGGGTYRHRVQQRRVHRDWRPGPTLERGRAFHFVYLPRRTIAPSLPRVTSCRTLITGPRPG